MSEKEEKKVDENIIGNKADVKHNEQTKDDLIQFKPGEMKFKGLLKTFIEIQQDRYTLYSMFEKEPDPYRIKRVIFVFTSKKGKSKRLIIQEEDTGPEGQ